MATALLTVLCRQADQQENVTVMGVDALDADSRRLFQTMTRDVLEPRVSTAGLVFGLPLGCATRFAQTLASVFSMRGIPVRVA